MSDFAERSKELFIAIVSLGENNDFGFYSFQRNHLVKKIPFKCIR